MLVDFAHTQGTDPVSTHMHGMAGRKPNNRYESPCQAYNGAKQMIRDAHAIGADPVAIHAIQDAPFDGHSFKPWKGVMDLSFLQHLEDDIFPDPDVIANGIVNSFNHMQNPTGNPADVLPASPCP